MWVQSDACSWVASRPAVSIHSIQKHDALLQLNHASDLVPCWPARIEQAALDGGEPAVLDLQHLPSDARMRVLVPGVRQVEQKAQPHKRPIVAAPLFLAAFQFCHAGLLAVLVEYGRGVYAFRCVDCQLDASAGGGAVPRDGRLLAFRFEPGLDRALSMPHEPGPAPPTVGCEESGQGKTARLLPTKLSSTLLEDVARYNRIQQIQVAGLRLLKTCWLARLLKNLLRCQAVAQEWRHPSLIHREALNLNFNRFMQSLHPKLSFTVCLDFIDHQSLHFCTLAPE